MRKTTLHIALLVVLGLYYNGASAVWLAYSTFAKDFFIERCENPTKPCCKGQCHVKEIEDRSGAASDESTNRVQVVDPQPTIPTAFSFSPPIQCSKMFPLDHEPNLLQGLSESLFRPPRV